MEWGRVQTTPDLEDEREGKDVNLGVGGSNSNGYGKEMDKEGHIMKSLKDCKERPRLTELIAERS